MEKIIIGEDGKATVLDIEDEQLTQLGYVQNEQGYYVKPETPAPTEGDFIKAIEEYFDTPIVFENEIQGELVNVPGEEGMLMVDGEVVEGEWTPPWEQGTEEAEPKPDLGQLVELLSDKLLTLDTFVALTDTQIPEGLDEDGVLAWLKEAFPKAEEVAVEPEPEPVPEEPKPTCRFFAPAASLAESYAAVPPVDWPYDRLFSFHGCICPAMNKRGEQACAAVNRQSSCMYYEAEEPVTLSIKRVRPSQPLGVPFEEKEITMVENRYGYGTPVVLIHSEGLIYEDEELPEDAEIPEPEMLHRADAQQHGDKLREVAQGLLEVSIQDMGDVVVEDQPIPTKVKPQPRSYMKELVS